MEPQSCWNVMSGDTASQLGNDAAAYRRLYARCWPDWDGLRHDLLKAIGWPRHPIAMARFGLLGLRSARAIADSHFKGARARALFAGLARTHFFPWSRRSPPPLGWC
jgi:phytoene dehydrogenase-like protein